MDYLTTHTSLSPIRHGFAPGFVNYKKGCTRLAVASDKADQLLARGRWFSPGTPASSTTKTGRHDIADILLKEALKHQKSNQTNLFKWKRICAGFFYRLLIYALPFDILLSRGDGHDPRHIHYCAYPKPVYVFPTLWIASCSVRLGER